MEARRQEDPQTYRQGPFHEVLLLKEPFGSHRENPIWKYGFIDLQGIVKGSGYGRYKNEITYLFKYLTKCVSGEASEITEGLRTINEAPEKERAMLFTHMANKCFRTRDISFGKTFKERMGLIPLEKKVPSGVWKRIRTIPGFMHEAIVRDNQRRALKKLREMFASKDPEPA